MNRFVTCNYLKSIPLDSSILLRRQTICSRTGYIIHHKCFDYRPFYHLSNCHPGHIATNQSCHHEVARRVHYQSSDVSRWNKAVSDAEKIVGYPTSFMSLRCLLSDELSNVALQMRKLIGTRHPLLQTARNFFGDASQSLQTRGLLVLLVSKAASATRGHVMNDTDPPVDPVLDGIHPNQRNLAEITEMIHTANLIHKGVVNLDSIQPEHGSVPDMEFGNKMSVLCGDFLLANSSVELAKLQNTEVVDIMSSAIGDLMQAEFSPLTDRDGNPCLPPEGVTLEQWEDRAYLSGASLIAKSCQAALMLTNHSQDMQRNAHTFGRHVSLAHQVYGGLQPFLRHTEEVSYSDVSSSTFLSSLPVVLYLASKHTDHQLPPLDQLSTLVRQSSAVDEAKQRCMHHINEALAALHCFEPSEARRGLEDIVSAVTVSQQ